MKRWIYILLALGIGGCENGRQLYEGEDQEVAGIYFEYAGSSTNGVKIWQDSIDFTFQNIRPDVKEYTISIPVRILGFVQDYPRTFKARVCGGTAVEGEDFLPLETEYVLPARKAETILPVILKRTDKLYKQKISIELELLENDYFHLLMPEISNGNDTLDATRFKVVYSEIVRQPFYWLSAKSYFGDFSVKKLSFLNEVMGWTIADWSDAGMEGSVITYGKLNYAATMVRNKLQALADDDDPVYEEDGVTFMQLGTNYRVDYSRYETD